MIVIAEDIDVGAGGDVVVVPLPVDDAADPSGKAEALRFQMCAVGVVPFGIDQEPNAEQPCSLHAGSTGVSVAPFAVKEDAGAEEAGAEREVAGGIGVVSLHVDQDRSAEQRSAKIPVAANIGVVPLEVHDQRDAAGSGLLLVPWGGLVDVIAPHVDNAVELAGVDVIPRTTDGDPAQPCVPDLRSHGVPEQSELLRDVLRILERVRVERYSRPEKLGIVEAGGIVVEELLCANQLVTLGQPNVDQGGFGVIGRLDNHRIAVIDQPLKLLGVELAPVVEHLNIAGQRKDQESPQQKRRREVDGVHVDLCKLLDLPVGNRGAGSSQQVLVQVEQRRDFTEEDGRLINAPFCGGRNRIGHGKALERAGEELLDAVESMGVWSDPVPAKRNVSARHQDCREGGVEPFSAHSSAETEHGPAVELRALPEGTATTYSAGAGGKRLR